MSYVQGAAGRSPEDAVEWIIAEVSQEVARTGQEFTDSDVAMLRCPVSKMGDFDQRQMIALNNRVGNLTRSAMDASKKAGAPCDTVRKGLRIPTDWRVNYQLIFTRELPVVLSGVLQNAMIENPMAGERRKWKSK